MEDKKSKKIDDLRHKSNVKPYVFQEYPKAVYHKDYAPNKEELAVGVVKNPQHMKMVESAEELKKLGSNWMEAKHHPHFTHVGKGKVAAPVVEEEVDEVPEELEEEVPEVSDESDDDLDEEVDEEEAPKKEEKKAFFGKGKKGKK